MNDLDFLNDFMLSVNTALPLSGKATLTSVAIEEKNGKKVLTFGLDSSSVYINLASQNDSEGRKKSCAINIFNTLYSLVSATSSEPIASCLKKANLLIGKKVDFVRRERQYIDANTGETKTARDLVSLNLSAPAKNFGF